MEIAEKVRDRNRLRRNMKDNRKEWIGCCKEVNEMIKLAKRLWKEHIEKLDIQSDSSKTWKLIQALDGKKGSKDPNKILKYNNQERYTDKSKANAFADYYANISYLKTNKEDRRIHKENCESLRTPVVEGMETSDYTPEELDRAIDQMKINKAGGPDDIPSLIKNMPIQGRERLLKIINASWHKGYTPNMWRRAIIIPLLKKDKDSEKVASYRPVSLTSCLGKIMERMVAARMMYLLEKNGNSIPTKQDLEHYTPQRTRQLNCHR